MQRFFMLFLTALLTANLFPAQRRSHKKEFLTEAEIAEVREAQEIDKRVKVYMKADALRLKTAEERLTGIESAEGDPLEFFTPEEMLDGYSQILDSVMTNLDAAYQNPRTDADDLRKALTSLKDGTEKAEKPLAALKKLAEEKNKEELWNLINKALDLTSGAHDGAVSGLATISAPSKKSKTK